MLFINLGAAQAKQGNFVQAEQSFRLAIDCDRTIASPHVQLAKVLFQLGHVDEAIAECRTALGLAPDDADAQQGLAFLLEAQSKKSGP